MYSVLSELFKFLYSLLTQSASLWSDHSQSHFSPTADVAPGDFPAAVHPRNNKDRSFVSSTYLLICPIRALYTLYTLQLLTVTFSLCHVSPLLLSNGSFSCGGRACFKSITIITIDNCRKFPIETIHGHIRVTLFQVIKSDEYFIEHCVLKARRLLWRARATTKETNVNRCLLFVRRGGKKRCKVHSVRNKGHTWRRCMPISVFGDRLGWGLQLNIGLCFFEQHLHC